MRLNLVSLLAHVLEAAYRALGDLSGWLLGYANDEGTNLAYRLTGWVDRLRDRIDPTRWCGTATALHLVCDPCGELAPGWWDWDVDCSGHDCRVCDTCEGAFESPRYKHDCTSGCHWLGRSGNYDLYVHPRDDSLGAEYLARYGDEGSQYLCTTEPVERHEGSSSMTALFECQRRHASAIGVIRQTKRA